MLAPPGYAKIASTPSRSRAATRISLPSMGGPNSARAEAEGFLLLAVNVVLLIVLLIATGSHGQTKNPRPLPAVGSYRNSAWLRQALPAALITTTTTSSSTCRMFPIMALRIADSTHEVKDSFDLKTI